MTKIILKLKGLREHESGNLLKSESGYAVGYIGMEGIILKLRFDPIGIRKGTFLHSQEGGNGDRVAKDRLISINLV